MVLIIKALHLIYLLFLSTILLSCAQSLVPTECQFLKDLYNSTNGGQWNEKWPQPFPMDCKGACKWHGIKCGIFNKHIIKM